MKYFQLNTKKPLTFYLGFLGYTRGLAMLVDGVVLLVSLGFVRSSFSYSLCRYEAKMYFKTLKDHNERNI